MTVHRKEMESKSQVFKNIIEFYETYIIHTLTPTNTGAIKSESNIKWDGQYWIKVNAHINSIMSFVREFSVTLKIQ